MFKQHKKFVTVSTDLAKYRVQVYHNEIAIQYQTSESLKRRIAPSLKSVFIQSLMIANNHSIAEKCFHIIADNRC